MIDAIREEDNIRIYHATRKTLICTRLIRREKRGKKGQEIRSVRITLLVDSDPDSDPEIDCNINKQSKIMPETWIDDRNVTLIKDYCS